MAAKVTAARTVLIKTRFMSVSPDEVDGRTPNKDSTVWRTRTDRRERKQKLINKTNVQAP
jgi:hypothetical protein